MLVTWQIYVNIEIAHHSKVIIHFAGDVVSSLKKHSVEKGLQRGNTKQNPFRQIQAPYSGVNRHILELFRYILAYSEFCVTLAYSEPSITLVYLEPWHTQNWYIQNQRCMQNPGIFKAQGILRILSNIYDGALCKNS